MPNSIIFDLESNSKHIADVSKIWCLSFSQLDANKVHTITAGGIDAGVPLMYTRIRKLFQPGITLIGHNIIAYDLPVLAKLVFKCPVEVLYKRYKIIDTLVISRVLDPDRDGKKHSLEDWGKRLGGEQKVEQKVWTEFDPNMITRCESDVRLTEATLKTLQKEISKNEAYTA